MKGSNWIEKRWGTRHHTVCLMPGDLFKMPPGSCSTIKSAGRFIMEFILFFTLTLTEIIFILAKMLLLLYRCQDLCFKIYYLCHLLCPQVFFLLFFFNVKTLPSCFVSYIYIFKLKFACETLALYWPLPRTMFAWNKQRRDVKKTAQFNHIMEMVFGWICKHSDATKSG